MFFHTKELQYRSKPDRPYIHDTPPQDLRRNDNPSPPPPHLA
ncbi:hypothetical protein P4662_29940 [Priestia megaterium]|nr:hypothetical protein [Priestia megaterium]